MKSGYLQDVSSLVVFQGPAESFQYLDHLVLADDGEQPVQQDFDPDRDGVGCVQYCRGHFVHQVWGDGLDVEDLAAHWGRNGSCWNPHLCHGVEQVQAVSTYLDWPWNSGWDYPCGTLQRLLWLPQRRRQQCWRRRVDLKSVCRELQNWKEKTNGYILIKPNYSKNSDNIHAKILSLGETIICRIASLLSLGAEHKTWNIFLSLWE